MVLDSIRISRNRLRLFLMLALAAVIGLMARVEAQPKGNQVRRPKGGPASPPLVQRSYRAGGLSRQALLYVPPSAREIPTPVLFVFHGHGGTSRDAAEMFGYHNEWREAIVVYPQGLNAPSAADPKGRASGWMLERPWEENRDIQLFDVVLTELEGEYQVDRSRIYASGFSHGGFFTYTLWAARPDRLAAVAPISCLAPPRSAPLSPKPVFYVGGLQDAQVTIERQRESIARVVEFNGCEAGRPGRRPGVMLYASANGHDVVTFLHPGGHTFPKPAAEPIVAFFRDHPLPAGAESVGPPP